MTVQELYEALQKIIADGHGDKDVIFPEGTHSSNVKGIFIETDQPDPCVVIEVE
jgi:hypothetical protein